MRVREVVRMKQQNKHYTASKYMYLYIRLSLSV